MTIENIEKRGECPVLLTLNPGDFAVWAPGTPHGSSSPHPDHSRRRSFQAIYRPTSVTRWGGYPDHDQTHDVASEETGVSARFNELTIPS